MPISPLEVLRKVPLFSGLPEAELRAFAAVLREKTVDRGGLVLIQGDRGDALYLVGEGQVKDPATGQTKAVPSAALHRSIKTDRISGPNWIVTGGLKPGDQIIVQGLPKAKENSPVKASPAQAAPAGASSAAGAAAAGQQ